MSRRAVLTEALAQSIAETLRDGVQPVHAARKHGVAKSTLYDWLRIGRSGRHPYALLVAAPVSAGDAPEVSKLTNSEPFVGRVKELAALRAGLQAARRGEGRLFLVAGEPGIGKTRTADLLAAEARAQGAQLLVGRCFEGEGTPPFWPWVQVARAYALQHDARVLEATLGRCADDLAHVVPEIAEKLGRTLSPPPALGPDEARFRFFDSVTTFLKSAARHSPLLIILDDLHWADKDSLLLLHFLARDLATTPLLLIAMYRDVALAPRHPLQNLLGELLREPACQCLQLQGLAQSEVAELIEASTHQSHSMATIASICRQTDGNPFFVREVLQLLMSEAGSRGKTPSLLRAPPSVREVIVRRVHQLSEDCQTLLRVAAVIGQDFPLAVLFDVARHLDPPLHETRVLSLVEEASAARILRETGGTEASYEFSHALIAETLYAEISAPRRMRLHQSIGEALETLPPARRERQLSALAHHFFEAARAGGDGDRAARYAHLAGERATTLFAYDEAVLHGERALQALDLAGASAVQRCDALLALGWAYKRAGNTEATRATLTSAASLARRIRSPLHLARAATSFGSSTPGVGIVDLAVVSLLEESLIMLPAGDSAERSEALSALARELYYSPSVERRVLLGQQAVEMARRLGNDQALLLALQARRSALWGQASLEEQLAHSTEMLELARITGDIDGLISARHLRANDLLEIGDIEAVDVEIESLTQLVDDYPQPKFRWWLKTLHATRAMMAGRFEEAERLAFEGFTLGQSVQAHTSGNFLGVLLYSLRREQGRLEEIASSVAGFAKEYDAVPSWRAALAGLYAETGRLEEARQVFETVAANHFADLPSDNSWLVGVTLLAETCAMLADKRRAEILYEMLLPHAHRTIVAGTAAACNGAAARHLALLAAACGRFDAAFDHFAAALQRNQALKAPPFVARTQVDIAAALLRCDTTDDRWPDAATLLANAHATASSLGMRGLLRRIESLHAGEDANRRATPQPVRSEAPSGFRREGDVWALEFRGSMCRLRASKGLGYLALLLQHPGREFLALELPYLSAHGEGYGIDVGDAGNLLDADAKAHYRERLRELESDLEEAQRFNDEGRVAKTEAEITMLTQQLAAAVGLGGRDRQASSARERARLSTTKAIKAAIQRISDVHSALGHHLRTCIRTGMFCSYDVDPTQPIEWDVRDRPGHKSERS